MILFRADGNPSIGSGHIMRCLSIADAAKDRGIECLFVTAGNEFSGIIEKRGFKDIVLGTDYRDMDSELEKLEEIILERKPEVVFVDSYFVNEVYLGSLKKTVNGVRKAVRGVNRQGGGKLAYIDDVLSFPYPCDVLINYNIYAEREKYLELYQGQEKTGIPEMFLNTEYAPLRKEFRPDKEVSDNEVSDILVSTGGADFEHLMIELVRAVKKRGCDRVFHFVVGTANEDKKEIYGEASGEKNIVLHENVTKMAELMRSCKVAISAAGSTLYELCATKVPTITYILADNQMPGADGFEKRGIMKCAGDIREMGAKELADKLIGEAVALCDNRKDRIAIAERQGRVVDGYGAGRIVDRIVCRISESGCMDAQ
ncbi:MAG: UDP-2,4-diacetamido-2,4,6-trideoxy-beta-L-altropyranose hydrolase [Lachnospiraceae bacterium]|nr:UDP-2,4-diacetamido-2,4,6-trideoxy-beta-L-altropyranose hydrolase [Lachnospiraceae bacterium]